MDKARGTIDVNQATKNDATPLLIACENGHTEVVTRLLAHPGVDVNLAWTAPNGTRYTPLSKATEKGHTDIATLLRDHTT